jgi:hypothetical protein
MNQKFRYISVIIILVVIVAGFAFYNGKNGGNNTTETQGDISTFKHPNLGFSFNFPNDYTQTQLEDDAGETILLQKNSRGAQIYISDFSADVTFNSQLVKKELSGEKIDNLKDINMAGGFSAVSFSSSDPSLGDTLEVWFEREGKLYQITAQSGNDTLLQFITDSWKFN